MAAAALRAAVLLLALASSVALAGEPRVEARILIQNSPLAGFQFHRGKLLWGEMKVGDALALVREPDNPYDPNAVRVDWRGEKLGYVPRTENADLARHMDRGTRVEARISRLVEDRNPRKRIRFDVFALP
ncbi:MAG TPA: HIRAN domain-containing protein [Burkholderiales bacterium]|nr:HIRAN domain-containing protein [Betaproteobacteria bacterium]HQR51903.1 HIRAN domain-containing protein [Burkholderiales bacterium]